MLPTPRIPPKYAALWSPGRIPPLSPPGAFFFVGIRQTLVVQRDPALASRGQLRRAHDAIPLHGVEAVPAPDSMRDRTFLSAVVVREWAKRSGLNFEALDVFSTGAHARRSRILYRLAFGPKIKVGVFAVKSPDYDAEAWWRTSHGAEEVVQQAIALLWVQC